LHHTREELNSLSTGSTFAAVGTSTVSALELPCVDPQLQRAIADYLDRETAQIDTLIAKQEELIGRLHSRRQALIKTEIAASIDPFAATDGASVRVGAHFDVTLGKMLDAGKQRRDGDTDLPYIRAANIQDLGLDLSSVYSMPYSPEEAATLALRAGDLLVVEGGAVGTSVVLDVDMPGWSFQKTVNRVRAIDGWSTRWLGYLLRSYRDSGVIDVLCNGSTIQHLTAEKLRALRVPTTNVDEQRRIVEYLDEQTAKIDTLIAKAERFIELAKERRAALITAAVTGQLDVTAA
jgi:type I restriction enzyme S subunit